MSELESISLPSICRGDTAVWKVFVVAAGPLLRAIIWRLLTSAGRTEECADVVQEVFVRLVRDDFRLLKGYDPQRAKLGTWLGVIATSTAIDWLRKTPPSHMALDDVPEHRLPIASPAPEREGEPLGIPAGLLPPRQALILKLLYTDDMDVSEVAALLNIEAQTVRSLRHKAISALRGVLKRDCDDKERG